MRTLAIGNRRRAASTAFTLLEMLVVISIIAIMASAVIPQFLGNPGRGALRNASTYVTNMMWFCHSSAAFDGRAFRLNYEPDRRRFSITRKVRPGNEGEEGFVPYRESGFSELVLPDTVTVKSFAKGGGGDDENESGRFVEFSDDGTAEEAAIVLADATNDACTIVVSGITSQVRIVDHEVTLQEPNKEEEEEE